MILKEKKTVLNIVRKFLRGTIDKQRLASDLQSLVNEKKGKNTKRPISPNVPRRDAIVIMVNTIVKNTPLLNAH